MHPFVAECAAQCETAVVTERTVPNQTDSGPLVPYAMPPVNVSQDCGQVDPNPGLTKPQGVDRGLEETQDCNLTAVEVQEFNTPPSSFLDEDEPMDTLTEEFSGVWGVP